MAQHCHSVRQSILQESMHSAATQVDGSVLWWICAHDAAALLHGAQKIWNTCILSVHSWCGCRWVV